MSLPLATRMLLSRSLQNNSSVVAICSRGFKYGHLDVGNREVVGYGVNGAPTYVDRIDKPLPAIRFRELTNDIKPLLEKEKGDWSKLTLEEKKQLYRYSFCQTMAELQAPTSEWKKVAGLTLFMVGAGLWIVILLKTFVYPAFPEEAASLKYQEGVLRKAIDLKIDNASGYTSKWDYEKDEWKK